MTASELTRRTTKTTALIVVAAALAGGWLGGVPGAAGVLAGGALALGSFRVLVARATAAPVAAAWAVAAALRFAAVAAVAAVLFAAGWAHPVAVLAGYTALPVAAVLQGLRLAREESASWT